VADVGPVRHPLREVALNKRRLVGIVASLTILLTLSVPAAPAGAVNPERFGALLTANTQPSNCCPPHKCVNTTPAPDCTWIMNHALNRVNGQKAPHDGTIAKIRLIAGFNTGGHFQLYLARAHPNTHQGKVIASGPTITYVAQPDDNAPYAIQTFTVNIAVHTGDRLAIRAAKTNILRCNSGSPNIFQYVPPLVVGQGFRDETDHDGCDLLLEAEYAP
jgi:hypothetical protein